jgi:starch-binding outer membrane protein, SusD/RagB family
MNKQNSFYKMTVPLLIVVITTAVSCKKTLYEAPITSTYGKAFWTSQKAVEQATLAMYGQLRSSLRSEASFFINGDLVSGAFIPEAGQWNYQTLRASSSPAYNFSYVPYLQNALQNWSRFYRVIAQANLILQNVPKMEARLFESETVRNRYIAEALFMRSYTYFYMIRIWGDPVFVTQTYDDIDYGNIPPVARTAEGIVLDSCIGDLKRAAQYSNFTGGDVAKTIRANKGSISALLAHIYAWKHDYTNAHFYCQEVINKGGYTLEPMATYTNIWKGQTSNESIFELYMKYNANDPNSNPVNEDQASWREVQFNFFGTFIKQDSGIDINKGQCWISPDGGMVDDFYDGSIDKRYNAVWKNIPATNGDVSGYVLLKYTNFKYQKPDTKTLPYLDNNLVLFRLADIILLDAEAMASTGNLSGAKLALAKTEDRAGDTSYLNPANQGKDELLFEITRERGRELVGEGTWYYDLIRTQDTQDWLGYVGYPATDDRLKKTQKGYYWPLDMGTLFPYDNLLTQNPYWATHR